MRAILLTLFTLLFVVSSSLLADAKEQGRSKKLVDGLYLVARKSNHKKELQPISPTERLLVDDGRFIEPVERGPIEYVVLDTAACVPFALSETPVQDHETGTGKPRLQMQFLPEQSTALADLTGKNVGRTVAIVVGGHIVTCHKIREAITGGKLQITRCTKHSCELIYSKLVQRNKPASNSGH